MKRTVQTAGIAVSVLVCLTVAGTVAMTIMAAVPYLLIYLLRLQHDWQMNLAARMTHLATLALLIAVTCTVARATARRGGNVAGIMIGVAAYPLACVASVLLTPPTWMEVRWFGTVHGLVALPIAIGVAMVWPFIRPRTGTGGAAVTCAARPVPTPWRPVA